MSDVWEIFRSMPAPEGTYIFQAVLNESGTGKRIGPITVHVDADAWQAMQYEVALQMQQNPGTHSLNFQTGIVTGFLKRRKNSGWNFEKDPYLKLAVSDLDEIPQPK